MAWFNHLCTMLCASDSTTKAVMPEPSTICFSWKTTCDYYDCRLGRKNWVNQSSINQSSINQSECSVCSTVASSTSAKTISPHSKLQCLLWYKCSRAQWKNPMHGWMGATRDDGWQLSTWFISDCRPSTNSTRIIIEDETHFHLKEPGHFWWIVAVNPGSAGSHCKDRSDNHLSWCGWRLSATWRGEIYLRDILLWFVSQSCNGSFEHNPERMPIIVDCAVICVASESSILETDTNKKHCSEFQDHAVKIASHVGLTKEDAENGEQRMQFFCWWLSTKNKFRNDFSVADVGS